MYIYIHLCTFTFIYVHLHSFMYITFVHVHHIRSCTLHSFIYIYIHLGTFIFIYVHLHYKLFVQRSLLSRKHDKFIACVGEWKQSTWCKSTNYDIDAHCCVILTYLHHIFVIGTRVYIMFTLSGYQGKCSPHQSNCTAQNKHYLSGNHNASHV